MELSKDPFFVRNLTFGIEDSIISTTGVLIGIAAAKFRRREILIAGFILILVEAMSMAYGAFLSEQNFMKAKGTAYTNQQIFTYAVIMFFSYFLIGLLLLIPYALEVPYASAWTVALAILSLFVLLRTYESSWKKNVQLLAIGTVLMLISIVVGQKLGG